MFSYTSAEGSINIIDIFLDMDEEARYWFSDQTLELLTDDMDEKARFNCISTFSKLLEIGRELYLSKHEEITRWARRRALIISRRGL